MTEKTPISKRRIVNKLTKNSFLRLSIAFKLIIIHTGTKTALKQMKNKDIPSTVTKTSPQLKILESESQL